MENYDVTALGELLIDFTENGTSEQGNPLMEANPGGAPCNVLAMLQKLGHRTAFIGKVGKDAFGSQLEKALKEAGIDTCGLYKDKEVPTTLAFVRKTRKGDRRFSFYRDPGADTRLNEEEVLANKNVIGSSRIFHFGTLSLTHKKCRKATRAALQIARENGVLISFDPNLREPLWDTLEEAREQTEYGLGLCDILKIADNEIRWLTGIEDCTEAARSLQQRYPAIKLITVSLGKEGSLAFCGEASAYAEAFLQEKTVDTTGAGDTFFGCILHYVLENGLRAYGGEELKKMLEFANAAASLITARKGALRVMPEKEEIEAFLRERRQQ